MSRQLAEFGPHWPKVGPLLQDGGEMATACNQLHVIELLLVLAHYSILIIPFLSW